MKTLKELLTGHDAGAATPRERFLIALALDSPELPDLAREEHARVRLGATQDYASILSPQRCASFTSTMRVERPPSQARGRSGGRLLQLLGSHDPYHLGHRLMIYSLARASLLEDSSASVTTMGSNVRKGLTVSSYAARHAHVARTIGRDPALRGLDVHAVDLPTGVGLSARPDFQAMLLAVLAGDPMIRTVMGSDKLALDAARASASDAYVLQKYSMPRRRFYVIVRQEHDIAGTVRDAARIAEIVDADIRVVPKVEYDLPPASSTLARQMLDSASDEGQSTADLLIHGVPDNPSDATRAGSREHVRFVHLGADELRTDQDPVAWRYESEHGCICTGVAHDES